MFNHPSLSSVGTCFADRSARGILTRAAGAWVLIGLPLIAARIWWSVPAALVIFVVGVALYVTAARRYVRRHRHTET
jgi:membrane protein implicated in regulation of membrane protease activity